MSEHADGDNQQFALPKFSPSQIGRKGKAQGQKAKGTEFEPRRSQNFLLKPLRPRAFSSRQGANIKPGLIRRALACANRGLSKLLNGRPARALVGATYRRRPAEHRRRPAEHRHRPAEHHSDAAT